MIEFIDTFDIKQTGKYVAPRGPGFVCVKPLICTKVTDQYSLGISVLLKRCLGRTYRHPLKSLGRFRVLSYWFKTSMSW